MFFEFARILIGPKPYNNNEKCREIDNLWEKIENSKTLGSTYLIFSLSYDLFREALACYQNNAYLATSIMCRDSLESAIYIMAIAKDIKCCDMGNLFICSYTYEECREYISRDYGSMLSMTEKKYKIDESIKNNLKEIRSDGNFAAHLAQKIDESYEEITKFYNKHLKKAEFSRRNWITKEEAYKTLDKTVNVLIALSKIVYETNCKK
jgi:5-methylcytosine-specific restriction endonuclease McrA